MLNDENKKKFKKNLKKIELKLSNYSKPIARVLRPGLFRRRQTRKNKKAKFQIIKKLKTKQRTIKAIIIKSDIKTK